VENYIDVKTDTREPKPAEAKAKVVSNIVAMKPDVIGFQEMGSTNAFLELRASLKAAGQDFPYWEHVSGWDTNIHVALLSKFPIIARRPHTSESYLLNGRRLHVSRGFLEADIKAPSGYTFTVFVAHLKSRRQVAEADESEMREQEALILREKIDLRMKANSRANIVVIGDLNDTKDTKSTRAIIGRGNGTLVDTRPAERNGDTVPPKNLRWDPSNITWTHFYGKEDSYSRIDYILVNRGMASEWNKQGTYVFTTANWGLASDHRPIIAEFRMREE
jgi:endonuclease/exonuclease/phosphatase family metal-dependent hydrolase